MTSMDGHRRERYRLVSSAHEFILTALPLRRVASKQALDQFVSVAGACQLPPSEFEAVFLHLLSVIDPYTLGRLPSLVDRYLAARTDVPHAVERFHRCVDDVIRFRGVGHPLAQRAIAVIERCYSDSSLTVRDIAGELEVTVRELSAQFCNSVGVTCGEYLRNIRLDRAAALLMTTPARIKEVWSQVGYNDGSNFVHQFKDRFLVTPRAYRARAIHTGVADVPHATRPPDARAPSRRDVLIIDDNTQTSATLARHLRLAGRVVRLAATGEAGMRLTKQFAPTSIVLDYHLPDTDGLEWLRAMRRDVAGDGPPVLLFTADWDVWDYASEIASLGGMIASKLCDIEELQRLLDSLETAFPLPSLR